VTQSSTGHDSLTGCIPGDCSCQFPYCRYGNVSIIYRNCTHAGRGWTAGELRLKSFEDLQRIWILCVREQNLLLTLFDWNKEKERNPEKLLPGETKLPTFRTKDQKRMAMVRF
jgi:hypothetical protein